MEISEQPVKVADNAIHEAIVAAIAIVFFFIKFTPAIR